MIKKTISALLVFMIMIILTMPLQVFALNNDYEGHWAEETINLWIDKGYINGYSDGSFKPDGLITRAEFVTMVNKLYGYTEKADINFTDVKDSDWYYEEIQKGFKSGYISGVSETNFYPNDNLTREQAAVIISKIMNMEENIENTNSFIDEDKISDWAKGYVNSAANSNLILGYKDFTFKPQNPIKRAEAIVILFRTTNFSDTSDLIIDKPETIIENKTVNNLHITKEIGDGEVTLKNVTVKGELLVEGGGLNTVLIENCSINKLIANKADGKLRILIKGTTAVDLTAVRTGVILAQNELTGNGYKEISLNENSTVSLSKDKKVRWSSSNRTVATVNTEGLITAKSEGEAIIYITTNDGNKTNFGKINVVKPTTEIKDETIKILSIGNSFSQDSAQWLYDIAASAGVDVVVGNLYISGCSLQTHWKNAQNNLAYYNYDKWTSSTVVSTKSQTMEQVILDEDWDYISLQQVSGDSGLYYTFQPYLNNLADYVKLKATNQNVKLALNMTWSYATNSTHNSFENYNKDQLFMYYKIMDAYKKASTDSKIDIIIPCGTAIQNGRTNEHLNLVGNELTNDGYHLNLGIGRYIAGLTYFQTLIVNNSNINKDLFTDVTFVPEWLNSNAYYAYLSKIAVKNAVDNPYKITIIK
ncbi:MAG: S-layer y protein [Bacillota bacterium]|nr:S-layer y protein [Bacillota bacterium]